MKRFSQNDSQYKKLLKKKVHEIFTGGSFFPHKINLGVDARSLTFFLLFLHKDEKVMEFYKGMMIHGTNPKIFILLTDGIQEANLKMKWEGFHLVIWIDKLLHFKMIKHKLSASVDAEL